MFLVFIKCRNEKYVWGLKMGFLPLPFLFLVWYVLGIQVILICKLCHFMTLTNGYTTGQMPLTTGYTDWISQACFSKICLDYISHFNVNYNMIIDHGNLTINHWNCIYLIWLLLSDASVLHCLSGHTLDFCVRDVYKSCKTIIVYR